MAVADGMRAAGRGVIEINSDWELGDWDAMRAMAERANRPLTGTHHHSPAVCCCSPQPAAMMGLFSFLSFSSFLSVLIFFLIQRELLHLDLLQMVARH